MAETIDGDAILMRNAADTFRRAIDSYMHGVSHGGDRDLYAAFGFERAPRFLNYYNAYKRDPVAHRIVTTLPKRCWQQGFEVKTGEAPVLVDELAVLTSRRGMTRGIVAADTLNCIGRFSVLYVGIPGQDPETPVAAASKGAINSVWFTAFAEDAVQVVEYEKDPLSARCGLPVVYELQTVTRTRSRVSKQGKPMRVHWSRVAHLAEGSLENPNEGSSQLEPALNVLQSIERVAYSGAEGYFRNARPKFALEVAPDTARGLSPEEKERMSTEADAFTNLQREFIRLAGTSAKSLNVPMQDPSGPLDALLQLIATCYGWPVRVLTGAGGGQYAGNEDRAAFNAVIADRQSSFCESLATRVLEILNAANVVSLPGNAVVSFPTLKALSELQEAEVSLKRSQAMANIANALATGSALEGHITPEQAVAVVLGMEYDPEAFDDGDSDD